MNDKTTNIITNPIMLNEDFLPENLIGRDGLMDSICGTMAYALDGIGNEHFVLYGFSGTGRYTLSMHILKELQEHLKGSGKTLLWSVVDCCTYTTSTQIFTEIIRQIDPENPFLKGKKYIHHPHSFLKNLLMDKNIIFLGIFRNVDQAKEHYFLNYLSKLLEIIRCETKDSDKRPAIITISIPNNIFWIDKFEISRFLSYIPWGYYVDPLSKDQIHNILNDRSEALFDNVVDEQVLNACAEDGAENNSIRLAIELLRSASIIAEKNNSERVTMNHLKMALFEREVQSGINYLMDFNVHYIFIINTIYDLMQENEYTTTSHVYEQYINKCKNYHVQPLSRQGFTPYINLIEEDSIIETEMMYRGRKGNTRKIMIIKDEENEILKASAERILIEGL
jgi:cell division control protein 6